MAEQHPADEQHEHHRDHIGDVHARVQHTAQEQCPVLRPAAAVDGGVADVPASLSKPERVDGARADGTVGQLLGHA